MKLTKKTDEGRTIYARKNADTETLYPLCAFDGEWFSIKEAICTITKKRYKPNTYLSMQLALCDVDGEPGAYFFFYNPKFVTLPSNSAIIEVFKTFPTLQEIIFIECSNLGYENLLAKYALSRMTKEVKAYYFFSSCDVEVCLGRNDWGGRMLGTKTVGGHARRLVQKRRRITASPIDMMDSDTQPHKVKLIDLIAFANMSLDDFYVSQGFDNQWKELATLNGRSKAKMQDFAQDSPDEFFLYATGDVLPLIQASIARVNQINTIVDNALGIGEPYNLNNVPMSSGMLVSNVFERWLNHSHRELFRAVLRLTHSTNEAEHRNTIKPIIRKTYDTSADLLRVCDEINYNTKYAIHGLAAASITAYVNGNYGTGTAPLCAIVQGGRCINEKQKTERVIGYILDADLSSCYGTTLRNYDYPFGLPEVYSREGDDTAITLGQFFDKFDSQLVDNLYDIKVSGSLSFDQDLIYSTTEVTPEKITAQLTKLNKEELEKDDSSEESNPMERELNKAHVDGKFALLSREIVNGVITADVRRIVERVWTNLELKEFRALTVESASFYLKRNEVSIREFIKVCIDEKTRGRKANYEVDGTTQRKVVDSRTRKWCRLPLDLFIGKFIDYRKSLKGQMKKLSPNSGEYEQLNLMQDAVKLFVNTTYGCLAAPFFPMGNAILANNITARARVGSWMQAKALNTRLTATDGGWFNAMIVNRIRTKVDRSTAHRLPGAQSFYSMDDEFYKRNCERVSLFDYDPINAIKESAPDPKAKKEVEDELNSVVNQHLVEFWGHWDLEPLFDTELKIDNSGYVAAHDNKADYAIETYTGKTLVKIRGVKKGSEHPKKTIMLNILRGNKTADSVPPIHINARLYGVGEWQNDFKAVTPEDFAANLDKIAFPHNEIIHTETIKPRKHRNLIHTDVKSRKRDNLQHEQNVRRYEKRNEGKPPEEWDLFHTIDEPYTTEDTLNQKPRSRRGRKPR